MQNKLAQKMELPYRGPYIMTDIFNNGTVRVLIGSIKDRVNIRHIVPYKERT